MTTRALIGIIFISICILVRTTQVYAALTDALITEKRFLLSVSWCDVEGYREHIEEDAWSRDDDLSFPKMVVMCWKPVDSFIKPLGSYYSVGISAELEEELSHKMIAVTIN